MSLEFRRETVINVLEEIKPLLQKHWHEIAHYKDIPLEPDYDQYLTLDELGMVRVFTARFKGRLIGYAIYFIRRHLHYQSCIMALQDVLFVDPEYRGCGLLLVRWSDEQLKAEGVTVVSQHIKASHNFGPALEKLDYQLMDLIYVKRLN